MTRLAFTEFDDSTHTRNPLGSFIVGPLGCDKVEHDIEALLGGERTVIGAVRGGGGGVRGELFDDGMHKA